MLVAVTPVQKVITLITELSSQIEDEGASEAAEYEKFSCFCKNQAGYKAAAIERSDEKIEVLTADITKLDADIDELNGEITDLGSRIEELTTEIDTEVEKRTKEHKTYVEKEADVSSAISAVARAIEALKASKGAMKDAKLNLAEIHAVAKAHSDRISAKQLKAIDALTKQQPAAYTFGGNDIIATLDTLKVDFRKEKEELDTTEFEARSSSDKKVLGLRNEKKFKEKSKAQKEAIVGAKSEDKQKAEKDKTEEENARSADEEFAAELTKQCKDRAEEFDQRSKKRAGELTALAEALEILKTGVQDKTSANKKLAQVQVHDDAKKAPTSFLQLRRGASKVSATEIQQRVLEHLDAAADRIGSSVLAAVAAKVSTQEDHFVKVRGIIKDLVQKLKDQAEAEATTKSFCDKEMGKAVTNRDEQALKQEEQTTIISEKTAEKAQLKQEIATLAQEIADLNKALNEATQLRTEEKANNQKTIANAGAGAEAVGKALSVLNSFYGALLQTQFKYTPPKGDRSGQTVGDRAPGGGSKGDYEGNKEASGGIVGLLEVIKSDFLRTEETVGQEEKDAQKAFDDFQVETEKSVEAKNDEKDTKETDVTNCEEAITTAKDDLKDAQRLHGSALEELDKLKPMCVDGEETYEMRRKKREDEIAALRQAQKILDEWKN